MRFPTWKITLLLLCLIAACAPQPVRALTPTTPPTAQLPSPTPFLSPTATLTQPSATPTLPPATATPVPPPALAHYTLTIDFSYERGSGHVVEEIRYPNTATQPLSELRLMVPLYQYHNALSLTGLAWLGGAQDGQSITNAVLENIQIVIPLAQPLQPGDTVGLKVVYDFSLPSQAAVGGERPLPIGYTSRQMNLVDWYLFVPPIRPGAGWLAHPPSYYGEYLVYDQSDFDVNLRLVDGPKGLIVAASAAAQADGDWLRYHRTASRTFALSIGSEYVVETAQVGQTSVSSYYFPANALAGKRALQTTVEALKLYSQLFGTYPQDTLAVVEADFYDGMEYDGLYFLSRAFYNLHKGDPGDYLVAIAAHETAHQWWYGIVGNDQANEPWLDEALCTYTERIFYEHYYPQAVDWWRQYRIDYYHPAGWVNTSVYNPQGVLQTYQDYRNAVYLNGARFMGDLRTLVGDDAFFAFLKDYATHYAGKIAFQNDFFALLAQHSKADLTPLLQKYFYTP
jgi:hypothetical protein